MNKSKWGALTQPPPDLADAQCAAPGANTPTLFDDETLRQLEVDADQPLPTYIKAVFEAAGVPMDMACGDELVWLNAAHTSARFDRAQVRVERSGAWVEFELHWSTARRQRVRVTRYLEVVALEDTLAMQDSEPIAAASARALADFHAAVGELLIRH